MPRILRSPIVLAGLGYLALMCAAYPALIANFSTAIPGLSSNSDYSIFYWNVWWFQHALFHLGQDPFYTNYILFPHTINLAYHTLTPFLDVIDLPIYLTLGPTVGINSLIVGSIVFSGLAMWGFLRHHLVPIGLAFVAGAFYAFSPFVAARMSFVHLNLLPIGWLPLTLLAWDRLTERRTILSALVLSGVLYAAFMTDQQYGLLLALLLPPYMLYRLVRAADWATRRKIVTVGAVALIVLIGLMFIAPLREILAGRSVNYPAVSVDQAQVRAEHLSDLIALPDRFINSEQVPLGILLPIGIVLGLIRGRKISGRWPWLFIGLMFLILSFGSTLEPTNLPLPYRYLHIILGATFRVPARFMLPAGFALITFAALSLSRDFQKFSRRGQLLSMISVIVLLAIENRWNEPFPVFSLPDYRIYHAIGAEPDQFVLLEVPVGAHNTVARAFGSGFELEYYSGMHHQQLLNGSVSRAVAGITSSYRQWTLITALAGEGPLPDRAMAQAELQTLSAQWNIHYVLIHRELISADLANWSIQFFNSQPDWCLVDEEGSLLSYRHADQAGCQQFDLLNPPQSGTINIGDGQDDRYLGAGWYASENIGGPDARWTGGEPQSRLKVHLTAQAYRVSIKATSYVANQQLTITANNAPVIAMPIAEGWGDYTFDLPAKMIPSNGIVTLIFAPARAQSAYDRNNGQVDDKRPLAIAYDSISLTPAP